MQSNQYNKKKIAEAQKIRKLGEIKVSQIYIRG